MHQYDTRYIYKHIYSKIKSAKIMLRGLEYSSIMFAHFDRYSNKNVLSGNPCQNTRLVINNLKGFPTVVFGRIVSNFLT